MSPEQRKVIQDGMTVLAKVPHYSGVVVVLFTDDFRTAGIHQHAVSDDLLDGALLSLVQQRTLGRSPIIVPPHYQNRAQRRQHGG